MAKLKPCGTSAAYRRHLRNGEEPCQKCLTAVREETRTKREKERAEVASKVRESEPVLKVDGELDPLEELRAQYDLLGRHLLEAPPQSVAAISRERRAILEQLTADKPVEASTGGVFDELAQRRKSRRAKA